MTIAPIRKPHAAMSASKALPSYAHGAREFLAKRFAIRVAQRTWIGTIIQWTPPPMFAAKNNDGPVTLK
jgi:hypothetical protein